MKSRDFLQEIIERKKKEVQGLMDKCSFTPQVKAVSGRFRSALVGETLSIIAEIKRGSPSGGMIDATLDARSLGKEYTQAGASAISVLTDETYFAGSLSDVEEVRGFGVPILRKEFIIDPVQIVESAFYGVTAVLLIVAILKERVGEFIEKANIMGLETLVEVHTMEELAIALEAKAPIIGINHRDLRTLTVDLSLGERIRKEIPSHVITVAESGIESAKEAMRLREMGFDALLVGSALVRSSNRKKLIEEMRYGC